MNYPDDILSCAQAAEFERQILKTSREELDAMVRAGEGVARQIFREFGSRLGYAPEILALAGKGHNGGDALCAAKWLLKKIPEATLKIFFAAEIGDMKPNAAHFAKRILSEPGKVRIIDKSEISKGADLMIEGLLGMSFKPPMRAELEELITIANLSQCGVKASIDLPAGMGDANASTIFKADVSYMTGIAKRPVFEAGALEYTGRLRYVDLDFFAGKNETSNAFIVSDKVFEPLKKMRAMQSDKRGYGHLFIFAGSANYPGAALMNARAAARSGAGLVSVFVPQSIAAALAAAEPACIWIPCPETEDGSLSLETFLTFKSKFGKETAILAGSGLGDSAETSALISEIVKTSNAPVVLDADAIRPDIIAYSKQGKTLITPHVGEFARLAGDASDDSLLRYAKTHAKTCILKGPISRVCDGQKTAHVCAGGPQLARGGSGDVLAGLAAGLAARKDLDISLFDAACIGAHWAGRAAELAFAACGENAYATSDVFNYLPKALNE